MFCGLFDYVSSNVPKILKSTHVKLIKFKRERFDNNVLANNKSIHITTASKLALFFAVFFFLVETRLSPPRQEFTYTHSPPDDCTF